MWMTCDIITAVDSNAQISYSMPAAEHCQARMAERLSMGGPDAILKVVFDLDLDVSVLRCSVAALGVAADKTMPAPIITELASKHGGSDKVSSLVRDLTRQAYAASLSQETQRHMGMLGVQLLQLGVQLARLWSLTHGSDQTENHFREVLGRLRNIEEHLAGSPGEDEDLGQRVDELRFDDMIRVLAKEGRTAMPHKEERRAHSSGELAVSWQGVSIEFLKRFAAEHDGELAYLSTDAVVERVVKPRTRSRRMFEQTPRGHALIEAADPSYCGKPKFFLSHAWRTTFHVPSAAQWRGGLVQAVVESEPTEHHSTTHFWFDTLCVNQHLLRLYFCHI